MIPNSRTFSAAATLKSNNTYRQNLLYLRQQGQLSTDAYRKAMVALNTGKESDLNAYRNAELGLRQAANNRGSVKIVGSAKSGYYAYDMNTGGVTPILPPAPGAAGGAAGASPAQVRKATAFIYQARQGYYANTADDMKPLPMATLRKLATGAKMTLPDYLGENPGTAQKAAVQRQKDGIGYYQPTDNSSVTARNADDPNINNLYLEAIHSYGLSRQQAFDVVAKAYPGWGARNRNTFFPGGTNVPGATYGAPYKGPVQTAKGAQQYAGSQLARYGWGPEQLAPLIQLWNNESGWNYKALNSSSGAAGIPQALGHALPANYASDPRAQINWGLNYIKQRYGSPARALAFWYSPKGAGQPQGHWY